MATREEHRLIERLRRVAAEAVELADELRSFGAPWSTRLGRYARQLAHEVDLFAQERRRDRAEVLRQLELSVVPKALPAEGVAR